MAAVSDIGGLLSSLYVILRFIGSAANNRKIVAKHIRNLYFVDEQPKKEKKKMNKNI